MKKLLGSLLGAGLMFISIAAQAQTNAQRSAGSTPKPPINPPTTNYLGWATNGPALVELFCVTTPSGITNPFRSPTMATNPEMLRLFPPVYRHTNNVFREFRPESLNYVIWTNFLTLTNGHDLSIWLERRHADGWPTNKPLARWNTNSVIWSMKGLTALSPCWQGEGSPGQVPLTALTRRHAYTRGHGIGPEGPNTYLAGNKAWFLTRGNRLVEAVVKRHVTRASWGTNGVYRDYTIVLFERDLPESIEPMMVATFAEVLSGYPFPTKVNWPHPIFQTEQGGYVSTGIEPLVVNTWKGGDSGSPNMIPLPGELVFFGGRSTSGPSLEMQEDMDTLCRLEGLDPKKYQLRHVDLSKYPGY
jgi:hypothetical protein